MSVPAYPQGLDLVWLAVDESGTVGAFITAGEGPIPKSALAQALEEPGLEPQILELPFKCEAVLRVQVPIATSFIELASRGLFVYDWQDAHRTMAKARGLYELVCQPKLPIVESSLPDHLRVAARATVLQAVSFGSATEVLVRAGT
jgi:hypothetical protein